MRAPSPFSRTDWHDGRFADWSAISSHASALPFLHHTEVLLFPVVVLVILWAASLLGFNVAKHVIGMWLF